MLISGIISLLANRRASNQGGFNMGFYHDMTLNIQTDIR